MKNKESEARIYLEREGRENSDGNMLQQGEGNDEDTQDVASPSWY